MSRIVFMLAAALVVLFQTGCNTVQGIGRDVEKAGEVIQGAARK